MTERRPGPDHALYAHMPLPSRPVLRWPGGARVAFCVFLYLEHWELDPPADALYDPRHEGPLGGIHPNYKTYSQFEYGNRVGIFRLLELLDRYRLPVTVAANAGACALYPYLVDEFMRRDYEFAAHGTFATRMISSRMSETAERDAIASSLAAIEHATSVRPVGWIGQDFGESTFTPALLAQAGLGYVADWLNDDQPYCMATTPPLVSIPNQAEWDDVQIIAHRKVHPAVHRDCVCAAFDRLHREGALSGAFFGLHLHPWLSGAPHRIGFAEAALAHIMAAPGLWATTAAPVAAYISAMPAAASE